MGRSKHESGNATPIKTTFDPWVRGLVNPVTHGDGMKLGCAMICGALSMAIGCAAATGDGPIVIEQQCTDCGPGGKSDDVRPAETVPAPTVVCGIRKGTDADEFQRQDSIQCLVSAEPGFGLSWASVLASSPQQLEEARIEQVDEPVDVAAFVGDKYPMDITIMLQFVADAVTPSNGSVIVRSDSVSCSAQLTSPDGTVECGKSFERWQVEIVPDAALHESWSAGAYRALSYDLRINPTSGDPGVRWDYFVRKGEDLAQSLTLLLDPAADAVTLRSQPHGTQTSAVSLSGPGRYELRTDGTLSPGQ